MALVSGFLRQKCLWTRRAAEFDAFGQPIAPEVKTIKCRWVDRSGWARGSMGDSSLTSSYTAVVMVDTPVRSGDTLTLGDKSGGIVKAVETVVDLAGKEQGRVCYV